MINEYYIYVLTGQYFRCAVHQCFERLGHFCELCTNVCRIVMYVVALAMSQSRRSAAVQEPQQYRVRLLDMSGHPQNYVHPNQQL